MLTFIWMRQRLVWVHLHGLTAIISVKRGRHFPVLLDANGKTALYVSVSLLPICLTIFLLNEARSASILVDLQYDAEAISCRWLSKLLTASI